MTADPRADPRADPHDRALYRELKRRAHAAGVYAPARAYHAAWAALALAAYALGYGALLWVRAWPWRVAVCAWLAACFVQLGLYGHEAGHGAITRTPWLRAALGHGAMTLLTGFSFSYWQRTHLAHHADPQREGVDPDMEFVLIGVHPRAALAKRGATRWITRRQHLLMWPFFALWGLSLRVDTARHVWAHPRATRLDQLLLALHLALWVGLQGAAVGYGTALATWLLVATLTSPYLAAILTVNHVGTRVVARDAPATFLRQQVLTARDLPRSWWRDAVFAGLNSQIEHHLFPTAPYANLHRARPVVKAFCEEHGIAYEETGWARAMAAVAGQLRAMAALAGEGAGDASTRSPSAPATATPSPAGGAPPRPRSGA